MRLTHPFDPIADSRSKILVLGSFPSIKSFEEGFYYAHPRNQFWPIIEALFGVSLADSEHRKRFALQHGIALWDTYASLVRADNNSSDANLTGLQPNDLEGFLQQHPSIVHMFCTGRKAYDGCRKHFPSLSVPCTLLPSTSPAYAAMPFEQKLDAYRRIKEILDAH